MTQHHSQSYVVIDLEEKVTEQDWEGLGIDPAKADDIRSQIAEVAAQAYEFAGAF